MGTPAHSVCRLVLIEHRFQTAVETGRFQHHPGPCPCPGAGVCSGRIGSTIPPSPHPELSLLLTHPQEGYFLLAGSSLSSQTLCLWAWPPQGCCLFPHGCEFPEEAGAERPLPVPGHGAWWRLSHCPVTDPAAILGAPPHPCSRLWVPAVPFAHSLGEHLVS